MDTLPEDIWKIIFEYFGYNSKSLLCLFFVSRRLRILIKRYCRKSYKNLSHFYQYIFWKYDSYNDIWKWFVILKVPIIVDYYNLLKVDNRNFRSSYLKFRRKWDLWKDFIALLSIQSARYGDIRFYRVSKSCFGCSFGKYTAKECFSAYACYLYETNKEKLKYFLDKQEGIYLKNSYSGLHIK
jgi:hypothetical protein